MEKYGDRLDDQRIRFALKTATEGLSTTSSYQSLKDSIRAETIRVTAHLVGAREWPAYEKARYLHYLRNVEFMDYKGHLCSHRPPRLRPVD